MIQPSHSWEFGQNKRNQHIRAIYTPKNIQGQLMGVKIQNNPDAHHLIARPRLTQA